MREIKFRAWDDSIKRWKYGELTNFGFFTHTEVKDGDTDLNGNNHLFTQSKSSMVGPWKQGTGLKDKNGKEIYEGDLLRNGGNHSAGQVSWSEKGFWGVGPYYVPLHQYSGDTKEVIGNIYENPELLEDKKS